jgi:enamine deaminase RidA (YjgF/YER057c/UK114 family)
MLLFTVAQTPSAKKRPKDVDLDPPTQTLAAPPELPSHLTVQTFHLRFFHPPLTNKGLLSQQVKDGLKVVSKNLKGGKLVRLRAFVAGRGDLRRVAAIVSEELEEKHLSLPVLTTVQVSALPMTGSQVALEAIIEDRKQVHPYGLAFFAGQQVTGNQPGIGKPTELVGTSLTQLASAGKEAGVTAAQILQVTCFVHALETETLLAQLRAAAPNAAVSLIELNRAHPNGIAECEAIGALSAAPAKPLSFLNPTSLTANANYSQVALVGAKNIVFTAARVGIGSEPSSIRQVFERLGRDLEAESSGWPQVAMTRYYPLYTNTTNLIRQQRFDFLNKAAPPASTLLTFEGLPGLDSSWGLDLIAVRP